MRDSRHGTWTSHAMSPRCSVLLSTIICRVVHGVGVRARCSSRAARSLSLFAFFLREPDLTSSRPAAQHLLALALLPHQVIDGSSCEHSRARVPRLNVIFGGCWAAHFKRRSAPPSALFSTSQRRQLAAFDSAGRRLSALSLGARPQSSAAWSGSLRLVCRLGLASTNFVV